MLSHKNNLHGSSLWPLRIRCTFLQLRKSAFLNSLQQSAMVLLPIVSSCVEREGPAAKSAENVQPKMCIEDLKKLDSVQPETLLKTSKQIPFLNCLVFWNLSHFGGATRMYHDSSLEYVKIFKKNWKGNRWNKFCSHCLTKKTPFLCRAVTWPIRRAFEIALLCQYFWRVLSHCHYCIEEMFLIYTFSFENQH